MNDDQPIIACTHDGTFHSDEVMACALLRLASGSAHVNIMRSRRPSDWERADFVIDVGGKYDGIKWFDHHQAGYNEHREDGTGYSAFGLLWNSLGVTMLRELLLPFKMEDAMIVEVCKEMEYFVKGIDLHDQNQLNFTAKWRLNSSVRIEVASLQTLIRDMNAVPFIEQPNIIVNNQQFYKALDIAVVFLQRLVYKKASKILANKYVANQICGSGPILELEKYCDWYDAVAAFPHILYVIHPSGNGKAYAVHAVKNSGGVNNNILKIPFPASWGGRVDSDLAAISGVADAIFCHRDRFTASAFSLEGARKLALKSIEQYERTTIKNGS